MLSTLEPTLVGPPCLPISLPSKPPVLPAQLQGQGGPGNLFLTSPEEGSRAERRRPGWGRKFRPPALKGGAGSTGHLFCSQVSRFPYAWVVFSHAWVFLYLCALCGCVQVFKWVYLRLCARKCPWYVCMTACLCVGWRLCMCLPISFLHVLAQLVALCVFLCT